MKLSIIVPSYPPYEIGGMELQAMKFYEQIVQDRRSKKEDLKEGKKDSEIFLVTKRYKGMKKKKNQILVPYINLGNRILNYIIYTISMTFTLLLKMPKNDMALCYMISPSGFAAALSNKSKRIVPWIRGGDWYFVNKNPLGRFVLDLTIKRSYKIIVQTENIGEEVRRYIIRRGLKNKEEIEDFIKIIGNGINIPKKFSKGDNLLFVGNLVKRKGVKYLIEAMNKMKDENLIIVGDGPEREYLEKIAQKNVKFAGKVKHDDLEKYYINAKCLILPSVEGEGMPNVILEAFSYGVPVISTNIAGIPDLVEEKTTGFIIETRNSEEIAKAVHKINRNGRLMGVNAKKSVSKYSWPNIIKQIRSL